MGNTSCALCKTSLVSSCIVISTSSSSSSSYAKRGKVVKVVKSDGKVMTFTTPVLVKDVLLRLSGEGSGIGTSKEANSEHLPNDFKLKIGKFYYELPSSPAKEESTAAAAAAAGGIKRIKIVITKQQLKELLAKQISVDEVLSEMEKKTSNLCTTASVDHHHQQQQQQQQSAENWKPNLESIPEGVECLSS